MVNENNYPGASTTLVGYASGEAKPPMYDKSGTSGVLELRIPVNEGYKKDGEFVKTGTTWYSYSAAGEYAAQLSTIGKGDKVRIDDAKQEVREYTNKENVTVKSIELRYGKLTVLEASGGAPASEEPPW